MNATRIHELPVLPSRSAEAHKGTFGRVLVVGGSRGMSGAVCLTGYAALRGGAGLVTLAVPNVILDIVAAVEPSWMTVPLDDQGTSLAASSLPQVKTAAGGKSVMAIGPGMGQNPDVVGLVADCYRETPIPLVVDADGLNALAKTVRSLGDAELCIHASDRVLTPHLGEFARLTGESIETISTRREEFAINYARRNEIVLLLKGPGTLITDGSRYRINETGNPGMATGGSGDVLTGLIAALIGQGMPAFDAASFAAHLHGLAGDLAAAEYSQPGMIASDLIRCLPEAWKQWRR